MRKSFIALFWLNSFFAVLNLGTFDGEHDVVSLISGIFSGLVAWIMLATVRISDLEEDIC